MILFEYVILEIGKTRQSLALIAFFFYYKKNFKCNKLIQKTLSILKPDAVNRNLTDTLNNFFEKNGLHVIAQKKLHLTYEQAKQFYIVHQHRPFFDELCSYISSGPVVVQVLEGENAVELNRKLMGDTDPKKAAPGTIRGDFGESISSNTVHGSDSLESAKEEITFFFSQMEVLSV